ncbi:adenylate/guanylate cyclase domain-containing protein [Candidatus Thiothrix sp. Deng01]|uniref:Adenylate/guanylate cyclase domain-containing protein n=1 Tax=Candidatus Thiothrix phosphatis TaxID=3112415 RepID=A0ABU6CSY1_9GAMM|nr:adenylate/guanylate cyclase domain-containing protein [Candidatus Thiothrix sp. Deng01]MEB4589701.1 adenylate/guanylate cyclase domain-containing protein [Candidatus Thiothrix sp. Deng01]
MVGIIVLLLLLEQRYGEFYSGLQSRLWNAYQYWGVDFISHKPQVTVIQIDDYSIGQAREIFGEDWPWSRQLYAALLQALFEDYHVSVAGLDITLPDGRDKEGNKLLRDIIQKYPVVLAQVFDMKPVSESVVGGVPEGGVIVNGSPVLQSLPQGNGYIGNNPQLVNIPCIGHINAKDSGFGDVITHVPPLIIWKEKAYSMLSLEMLRCKSRVKYNFLITPHANGIQMQINDTATNNSISRLIIDEQGYFRIPFQVPNNHIPAISAIDVILHEITPEQLSYLQSRMVIIAGAAWGVGDSISTPIDDKNVFGVTAHVQLLEWLLSNKTNAPDFSLDNWSWVWGAFGIGLLYALLFFGLDAGLIVFLALSLMAGWLGLGFWVWVEKQWFLPMHPAMLFLFFLVFQIPIEWWLAQHTSGRLRRLFQGYLPAPLVSYIVNDNHMDLLLPKKRCLTILFADIANFTGRAEYTDPEELSVLIRKIFESLTMIAHKHKGTVDKYMGDAVMVFWNAPIIQPDHSDRSVQAALEMLFEIHRFNGDERGLLRGEEIAIRIGIHTGEVIVGDLGTSLRHAYTAIGDAVNVAARLQSVAKDLGEHLLVSGSTTSLLQKNYPFVSKGNISLKGRQETIEVYALRNDWLDFQ